MWQVYESLSECNQIIRWETKMLPADYSWYGVDNGEVQPMLSGAISQKFDRGGLLHLAIRLFSELGTKSGAGIHTHHTFSHTHTHTSSSPTQNKIRKE